MNRAVILDRDGTINVDKGYIYKTKDFEFKPGSINAIKKLNDNNYKVIVVTNQSGIERGFFTKKDVTKLHNYINSELEKHNAHIDKFYCCPHNPEISKCACRKPSMFLHLNAIRDFSIDINYLTIIGDKESDIIPAIQLNCDHYLVNEKTNLEEIISKIIIGAKK